MDDDLLESLLHDDEGASLDFKREQYPFAGASREEKGELLKDLLAMANAWRTGPGHILVGVEEVRGGRSRVVGEDDHPAEHNLQQFVGSRSTNRPLEFSYRVYEYEGERVGIFRVPLQPRPIYLERDYGGLEAETVYLRRGSATVEADLEEALRMKGDPTGGPGRAPTLELEWADLEARERLGTRATLEQVRLHPKMDPDRLKPRAKAPFDLTLSPAAFGENPTYYDDLVEFVYLDTWLTPLGFSLKHSGGAAAKDVELVAEIKMSDGLKLLGPSDAPLKPMRSQTATIGASLSPIGRSWENDVTVEEHPGHWTVTVPFGDLAPERRKWTSRSLYVGAAESTSVEFTARLFAENLLEPIGVEMKLDLEVEARRMRADDVRPHIE